MTSLLTLAGAQIARQSPHSNRIAAWLTRTALEQIVDELLRAKGIEAGRASGRARLACLEVAYHDQHEVPSRSQYAWTRLSEACHQHAYQLSPTYQEVQHLLEIVRGLQASRPAVPVAQSRRSPISSEPCASGDGRVYDA
ncbi:hypothetical protein [Nocardia bhagyanarayanae]|uniref:Uncharacterized protein n=1 Tax=Nocardia bhagyanarayanae TaxID=1215925 RepID=A0A543EWF1_9NOCA|nr:hypothetical protein [Nocardia bhagyanarayanae]TQM25894.1 hypothetical protein FB390_6062 [Nocardia bhagyanarayanae]